jgi:hypothetical protein
LAKIAFIAAKAAQIAVFPLNCRRQAQEKPPNDYFVSAGASLLAAEMTQMQRHSRSIPPPRKGTIAVQFVSAAAVFTINLGSN